MSAFIFHCSLPMDAIPGLNQNGTNSASAVPATPATGIPSANNTISLINNANNNGNGIFTINNGNTGANTGWKNTQPAVSAQDAVPSRILSTPTPQQPSSSTASTSVNKEVPLNPWKALQKTHNS